MKYAMSVSVVSVILALSALGSSSLSAAREVPSHAVEEVKAVDEVKAATLAFYAALNRADADAADRFLLPGGDSFPRSGVELDVEAPTREESLKNLRAIFADLHADLTVKNLSVKAYGDAAVATFYTVGTMAHSGKVISQGTFRASYVWVRTRDGWKIAHFHLSPLLRP